MWFGVNYKGWLSQKEFCVTKINRYNMLEFYKSQIGEIFEFQLQETQLEPARLTKVLCSYSENQKGKTKEQVVLIFERD